MAQKKQSVGESSKNRDEQRSMVGRFKDGVRDFFDDAKASPTKPIVDALNGKQRQKTDESN